MNTLLSILFPRVSQGLVRLRSVVGLTQNTNTMARLSTEEEIQVINKAISAIQTQKSVIADLRVQLGALPQENADLKAALEAADASDAQSDESLTALNAVSEAATETTPTE